MKVTQRVRGAWIAGVWRFVLPAVVALMALASISVGTTSALLSDHVTNGSIHVTGGTVNQPTGFSVTDTGSMVRASWTAPASGITPQQYDIYRRPSAGSYGASPTGTSATSPWNDTTAIECTTWFYRVQARHTNLTSSPTAETSIYVDRTAPVASSGHLIWTAVTPNVADFVRVNPGGTADVYANVTDNCSSPDQLTVNFSFAAPFNSTVPTQYDATGWTPIAGGPTYHFRFQYTLPANAMSDGQQLHWSIDATDVAGNTSSTPGTPITADGQSPVFQRGQMVSAFTNFYDLAYGVGEIPSDGTEKADGSYIYGDFSDASGIASMSADLDVSGSRIKTGATVVSLTEGAYSTYANGSTWQWRSAATTINTGLPNGTRQFTLTATDKVGNAATISGSRNVEIDDKPPAKTGASCTNVAGAGSNNKLAADDSTEWNFGDTIWPDSIRSGWDGSTLTADALLRNGTRDYFDLNGDFGLTMFSGSAYNKAWNLNATTWVTAPTTLYAGSTFTQIDASTVRLTYEGTSSITARTSTAKAMMSANLRDAAGNKAAGAYTLSCTASPW